MYIVSQITPLEWKEAAVCNHEEINDTEFHFCENSLNSIDGHENFINGERQENCSENYSSLECYFKNINEITPPQAGEVAEALLLKGENNDDIWMNMEHRQNFLRQQRQQYEFGSSKLGENLDIDDDGLIGFEEIDCVVGDDEENERRASFTTPVVVQSSSSTLADNETDEMFKISNIELISYENNFSLKNSFYWAMGTLLQTSDLYPKVINLKNKKCVFSSISTHPKFIITFPFSCSFSF